MESWEFWKGIYCSEADQVPILQAVPDDGSGRGTLIDLGLWR